MGPIGGFRIPQQIAGALRIVPGALVLLGVKPRRGALVLSAESGGLAVEPTGGRPTLGPDYPLAG